MSNVESLPECFLGSVVNPGEYWLVSKLKTHVKDVKMLEEKLSDEMNQILTTPDPQLLVPHCCVAVENSSAKGHWQRGKIMEESEKNVYTVFLVDCGNFTDVGIRHLQLIENRKYLELEPLAFKVQLYGVVPFIVTDDLKKKVSESWSPSATEFIKNLFLQRLFIYVKKVHIINRIVFGDLYLIDKANAPSFSLGKLLCIKEYGVYAETYFKKKVMASINSSTSTSSHTSVKNFELPPPPDIKMKLDRVKEWQLSTVQYQEICHEDGSGIIKSPSGGTSDCEDVTNCRFNKGKIETVVTPATTRKESLHEEVATETLVKTSQGDCNGNPRSMIFTPRRKSSSESVGTAAADIPSRLTNNKKEFNVVVEENLKESRSVEDDSSIGIFTCFTDSSVQPVNKLRNLNISESIVSNLEKEGNFNDLSPIQRWAIPSIQRGHNTVIVGGAKTGKTLSYIIPFLAVLQDRIDAKEMCVGNGPVAIILCSGSRSCDIIYYICHLLLRKNSEIEKARASVRVEVIYGSSREKKSWVQLTNGCELLISTPHCLARLLRYRGITNLERLDYLVLDEVDVIIQEPFLSPIKVILHQSKLSKDCQRVFCGEKWMPELGNLINTFAKSHAILIGSYLEAAVYAKLKPHVLFVDKEKKSQIILDATLPKIGKWKIVIACEYTSEVFHLWEVFKTNGCLPLIAHSDMVLHDIKGVEHKWKSATDPPIIICCDDVIHLLAIDDAEMLVHYSLPRESKTNFGKRFSTLMKSYRHFSYSCQEGPHPKESNSLVLIDDENHYQLPHVVDFVLRLGGKIPDEIGEMSREISWRIETNKKDVQICRSLLEFGECQNGRNCPRRHAFIKEIDSPEVSLSGLVKFAVLQVHSVCYLSVRVIEVIDEFGKKTAFENLTGEIADKLREFYKLEENRCFEGGVEVNKLCAVEREDGNGKRFERARIIEFKKFNKLNRVIEVLVKFLDSGQISRVSVYKLYELPEDLKRYIPQALDIFLCGLLPNDFDRTWNEEAIFSAKSLFTKPLKENQFWVGRIKLTLRHSLHLESVKLCRFLENVKTHVIDFSARKKLLSQGIAVENEKHLEKLSVLCQKANIEVLYYRAEEDKLNVDRVEPQWAFLDGNCAKVEFVSADSTSCLFLRMAKFRTLLIKLEKECQKVGDEMKTSMKAKKWIPRVGMYCLALYENRWNRGKIHSIENDKVLVFFIDYGDNHYIHDLLPIPGTLLKQLPAQAIECSLVGVKHKHPDSDAVLDEIYSFSNGGAEELHVIVIGKSEDCQMTGRWKYQVKLVNADGVSLARKLVEAQLVEAERETFHLADNIQTVTSNLYDERRAVETGNGEELDRIKELCCKEDEVKCLDGEEASCIPYISDKMFDDENARLMIEEFMAHVFPRSVTEREEENGKAAGGKASAVTAKKCDESAKQKKTDTSDSKCKRVDKWEAVSYTPQLLWSQDHSQLHIKIVLNNVERYRFTCSPTHFLFRCLLDGKLYVAGLRLFGSVNPHLTQIRLKPFYVRVTLMKICPLQWPRLPRDKHKYRWIKYDVEDYAGAHSSYVEGICKKALAEIESGHIKQPRTKGDIQLVPSSDSDDVSESDSDTKEMDNFI